MGQGYGTCRGFTCKRKILWAATGPGKSMPLDPQPNPDGNVAVQHDRDSDIYRARVVTDATPLQSDERLFMPHFATCPDYKARTKPKTVLVTKANASSVARRKPEPAVQLDLDIELPDNVIPFAPRAKRDSADWPG